MMQCKREYDQFNSATVYAAYKCSTRTRSDPPRDREQRNERERRDVDVYQQLGASAQYFASRLHALHPNVAKISHPNIAIK